MTDTTPTPTPQAYNKTIREWIDRHDINFGTFDEARAAFEDAAARAMESRALAAEAEVSRLRGAEPRACTATEAAEGPVFDRDGYPTDRTLELITTWPYDRFPELWAYLREAWNYTYGAMSEGAVEGGGSEVVLITGGWSGNESIVSALASNFMFRAIFWYQDTRGGRHVYRIPTPPEKE